MSLNKVLNRPLFRQQALKKGALKPIKARIGQMIGPPTVNVTGQMQRNFPVAINQQGFFGRNIRPAMQRTGRFLKGSFGIRPLIAGTGTYMLSDDILTKLGVTGPLKTAINFGAGALGVTPAGRIIGYGYSGLKGLAALADKVRKDNPESFVGLNETDPYGTTFNQITGGVLSGEPLLTGDRAINPFRKLDPTKPRGRGVTKKAREKRIELAKQAAEEGSEGAIVPDALKQPDNSIVVNNQPIGDLNEIVTNAATPRDPDITMRGDPEANLDMQMKPEAPVEEPGEKKSTAQLEKEALDLRAGRTPGTDATLALAREYFNELNEGQPPSQARNVFLSTLAAGLMSGTTRKQGLGGALEVLGQALGPAMNNYATLALKEGELRQKNREASLNAALNHMKALNTAAKSPDRTGGVIQYRTPDGELRNTVGFRLKDGTIQRPVVIDGRQAFVTVPQGGPITDAQGNVIGVVQQFREQKDIDKRLFDIEDVLGNRYTAYSTTLDVLKTLNRLTPEGETVKAGAALTVDAFVRRTTGVAKELLGIEIGATTAEAEKKLQQYYDDEVAAIERDPDLSEDEKKNEIANILNKDGLIKEAKKRLKKNTGWFSGLNREEQEKLAVQEVSLIYALANTFKDQDRLTQRDINAAREIVNIFSLSRSSKDVKASIEAIGNQLAADIKRQERLFTNAGGLYSTILDLRQLKNFTAGAVGDIAPSLEKAFTEKEIRETLEDVNL